MKKPNKIERRSDFVLVRLTAAGEKFAQGALRHTNRHVDYCFTPGEALEVVERYEWTHVLSKLRTPEGELILEIVPDELAAPAQISEEGVDAHGVV